MKKKILSIVFPVLLIIVLIWVLIANNGRNRISETGPQKDTSTQNTDMLSNLHERLLEELDSTEIYDGSIIYGFWFKPHEACAVNVFFHKDKTFEFMYYETPDDTTIVDVVKKGTFTMNGDTIKMVSYDGWNPKWFDGVMYRKWNKTNYYLTDNKGTLFLVKGHL